MDYMKKMAEVLDALGVKTKITHNQLMHKHKDATHSTSVQAITHRQTPGLLLLTQPVTGQ